MTTALRLPLRPMSFSHASSTWAVSPEHPERIDVDALRVVTLNAWFEPFEAARRADALIQRLEDGDADVVCLQEVTTRLARRLRAAEGIRDEHEIVCSTAVDDAYGLAILSRLPIASAWELELSSLMNRALLGIELATTRGPLTIATVHLESTRALAATRTTQLAEIFAALDEAILVGDFNFDPRDPEECSLDPRFVDVWPLLRADDPGYTEDTTLNLMRLRHHGGREKHVRYDRVFAHLREWRARAVALFATEPVAPGVHVSDHFGVEASFTRSA